MPEKTSEKTEKFTLRRHLSLLARGYRVIAGYPVPLLTAKALSSIADALFPFVNIYCSARLINELFGARDPRQLLIWVCLTVGVNFLLLVAKNVLQRWSNTCNSIQWHMGLKTMSDKLLKMDFCDIEDPEVQAQYQRIQQHTMGMGLGLVKLPSAFSGIIRGVFQVAFSVTLSVSLFTSRVPDGGLTALNSPWIILAAVAALLIPVVVTPMLDNRIQKSLIDASEHNNRGNRILNFYLGRCIEPARNKDVRIYAQADLIMNAIGAFSREDAAGWGKRDFVHARNEAVSTAVTYACSGLIYLFVAFKAYGGAFGVGNIVQYVGATAQFSAGVAGVLTTVSALFANNRVLAQVLDFLERPNRKYEGTLPVEKRRDNKFAIEFHDVTFRYPGTETDALSHLNLKLTIGERLAVVGRNGSGKTTMIKLLCRLYDPTEGYITLNGIDIRKYDYDEYLSIFSVVFQDFCLLSQPLGNNVAAASDYDDGKVRYCCEMAGLQLADDDGTEPTAAEGDRHHLTPKTTLYKTLSEKGVEISGGEAQKLALARALYKSAPFVILDEPTAALDPMAEYEIYTKFNGIVGDRTAVYISHRLASCRFCDDIAVFEEGRLVQRGSHEQLLGEADGTYAALWNAQAQYYT